MESFLPEIETEQTRKNVEKILEDTKTYKQIMFVRREMKVTPAYEERLHGPTNDTSDPAAECAIWNADTEKKIELTIRRVENAINKLNSVEKDIIRKRYLDYDEAYDYTIYQELFYSKRKYYRIKASAFYKLAFMLKLEVYKED